MSTKPVNKLFLIVTYIVVKMGGRLPERVVFVRLFKSMVREVSGLQGFRVVVKFGIVNRKPCLLVQAYHQ